MEVAWYINNTRICKGIDFTREGLLCRAYNQMQKPKDTPFELLAVLLLTSPAGETHQKLVLRPQYGERNHQG